MTLELQDLSNVNTRLRIKFEFQKNNKHFITTSMHHILNGICLSQKRKIYLAYLKFKFNCYLIVFMENLNSEYKDKIVLNI